MSENYTELSKSSTFIRKLAIAAQPIYAAHMQIMKDNDYDLNFDELGTPKEKLIKGMINAIGSISNYFDDLYKTLDFLRVDKRKIQHLYPDTISSEIYYKYHYDNFVIRIMTSFDLCGKLGNVVYQLNIQERYANGYAFITHSDIRELEPAQKGAELSDFLENFKQQRHLKVHKGENPENRFDKIVYWDTINKIVSPGEPTSEVLEDYTQEEINAAVDEVEQQINEASRYVVAFIDSMEPKQDEIISNY